MGASSENTTDKVYEKVALVPLKVPNYLAGTPKMKPRFGATVQLNNGEQLVVADPRATRAMVSLMDMNALHGGAASHFGGPSAFAELMSAAHGLMFYQATKENRQWYDAFHFVNDAGHTENGLYALKANYGFADLNIESLKKFRSIESNLTGHGEAHLFPQGVLVSNGPLGSGIPQAQGLAIADAIGTTRVNRTTICSLSDGASMEGEAKEALAAIPGFAKKGKLAPFILIISDNRTKLSGRIEQDAYSMEPTFNSLEALGWRVMRLEDGNHLQACVSTLEEALSQVRLDPTVPIAIHAHTIKGKGNKKAEQSSTGAHGFPLKKASEMEAFLAEIYTSGTVATEVPAEFKTWTAELSKWEADKAANKAAPAALGPEMTHAMAQPSEKIQAGVSAALIKARGKGLPIISVSADLQGSTGLAEFHKAYPESGLDVGVAESNMISTAVGLSIAGYIPIVDTFAQFGVTKGALPITMSSLSQAPIIGVFSHTGFQDAADGASHQAISFYAQVSSIPNVEVYSLSTSSEAEALLTEAVENFASHRAAGKVPPSRLFFLGRENFPRRLTPENKAYGLGKDQIVADTAKDFPKSVTIVANGSLVVEGLKAVDQLREAGIGAVVIHSSSVNQPDLATITPALKRTGGCLITVEDHRIVGGIGAQLVHALASASIPMKVKTLGVGDHFGQSAYSALDLYKKHKLDSRAIVEAAKGLVTP